MTTPYVTGTVSVTAGSAVVTGIGTAWQTTLITGGTLYVEADGNPLPILSVDSDTEITAAIKWTGATGTYAYAIVRDTAYGQQLVANAQALASYIARLDNASLAAIAALVPAAKKILYFTGDASASLIDLKDGPQALLGMDGAADKLPYFNAPGSMTLTDFKAWARSLLGLVAAADKFPYFTDANTAALADFKASARSLLGLAAAADRLPYFSGPNTAALATFTAFARSLLDDADAEAVLGTLAFSDFSRSLRTQSSRASLLKIGCLERRCHKRRLCSNV